MKTDVISIGGSAANVTVASVNKRTRTPSTARLRNRRGFPVMRVTWVVATILYAIGYGWMRMR